jgi:hypothetical protein
MRPNTIFAVVLLLAAIALAGVLGVMQVSQVLSHH